MRWRTAGEVVGLVVVSFVVGQLCSRGAAVIFPHSVVGYVVLMFVGCFGGGCLIGTVWSKLTWPRRRRELLKQWGIEDKQP